MDDSSQKNERVWAISKWQLYPVNIIRGRPKAEVLHSAENRNQKSIVSGPKPSASLMPACRGSQAKVSDADVDSAASFLGYLYIVSQYTVSLMTPCVWRILYHRNSSSVPYFRQPPNLPTAARRNQKCTEYGTTAFSQNRMSAESAHLFVFGAETETDIRLTAKHNTSARQTNLLQSLLHDSVT